MFLVNRPSSTQDDTIKIPKSFSYAKVNTKGSKLGQLGTNLLPTSSQFEPTWGQLEPIWAYLELPCTGWALQVGRGTHFPPPPLPPSRQMSPRGALCITKITLVDLFFTTLMPKMLHKPPSQTLNKPNVTPKWAQSDPKLMQYFYKIIKTHAGHVCFW